ncbi:hypothetical protein CKAN_01775900 [Cinnamomum micranthum f. kanehirae]|uniref:Uncharacterized protein n=1 Tax=Cinnamomum micranthum f. kanehirae TaxID=337451 RepID=A0A3S3NB73_9MAGN|nr:hypothetical protein CKAN_01775900 [Cinnamomum micranthum f. kanehirae]
MRSPRRSPTLLAASSNSASRIHFGYPAVGSKLSRKKNLLINFFDKIHELVVDDGFEGDNTDLSLQKSVQDRARFGGGFFFSSLEKNQTINWVGQDLRRFPV